MPHLCLNHNHISVAEALNPTKHYKSLFNTLETWESPLHTHNQQNIHGHRRSTEGLLWVRAEVQRERGVYWLIGDSPRLLLTQMNCQSLVYTGQVQGASKEVCATMRGLLGEEGRQLGQKIGLDGGRALAHRGWHRGLNRWLLSSEAAGRLS